MRRRTRNRPGTKREKEADEEEGERRRAGEKTKLPVDASVGMRKQTNAGGNECFMEPPWLFSARVEGNDKGVSQTEVCVCVRASLCAARREEKGEGRRNND